MEPFIGQVIMFAGNFAPRSWAFCNGQLMSIAQNTALFSILGTTYGGDGRTTFALPDLRGRVPVHPGTGPGLSTRRLGQRSGVEYVNLTSLQLPAHTHYTTSGFVGLSGSLKPVMNISNDDNGTGDVGTNAFLGKNDGGPLYADSANDEMNTNAVTLDINTAGINTSLITLSSAGASQAVYIMQPWLGLNYIIALQGTFPSRS